MRIKLFFFLTFLFNFSAYSQKFEPGYIITNEGVRIDGFIKNNGPHERSELIHFKENISSQLKTYLPDDLSGFKIDTNLIYKSVSIQLSDKPIKKLFFRLLVDGQYMDLYRLDYQLRNDPDPFINFVNTFYFFKLVGDNNMYEMKERSRVSLLKELKKDCGHDFWEDRDGKYRYSEEGLSLFAVDYNTCRGDESIKDFSENEITKKLVFGIAAGAAKTNIEAGHSALKEFNHTPQLNPSVAFHIETPILKRRALIQLGISYTRKSTQGVKKIIVNEFYENEGDEIILHSDVALSYVNFFSRFKYQYNKGKVRPYMIAGGYYGLRLKGKAIIEREYFFISESTGNAVLDKESTLPYKGTTIGDEDFGYELGIGIGLFKNNRSNFFTEFLYSSGLNHAYNSPTLRIENKSYRVMVGYMF